jgi:hypothetical protein
MILREDVSTVSHLIKRFFVFTRAQHGGSTDDATADSLSGDDMAVALKAITGEEHGVMYGDFERGLLSAAV